MKIFAIFFLLTGLINIGFGAVVFFKNKQRLPNRIFPFFSINLAIWCFIVFGIVLSKTITTAEFLIRSAFAAGCFLPANFHLFAATLGRKDNSITFRDKKKSILFYVLSLLLVVISYHSLFIKEISFQPQLIPLALPGPEAKYNTLFFTVYIFSVLFIMAYSLCYLFKKLRQVSGIFKVEIQYVF